MELFPYHEKEAEAFIKLLDQVAIIKPYNKQLYKIIQMEATAYCDDRKSLDEAVRSIETNAKLFFDESM